MIRTGSLIYNGSIKNESKVVAKCKNNNITIANIESYTEPVHGEEPLSYRPVVIGAGPAGLFAALLLAEHGYRPILVERGQDVDTRTQDVEQFWQGIVRAGGDHVNHLLHMAPRPAAILATKADFFPIEGVREAY